MALSIRLIGLDQGIWLDEALTIQKISTANPLEILQNLRRDNHPPLYYILLYFWSKIIANTEESLRLFSVLFGVGTVVVVMRWLKQYSCLASILAGIYFSTAPIMLRFSQEIKGYSLLLFATALAFFFASRVIAKPEKFSGYIGLTLSLTIAISTHLIGIMLLAPIFLFVVIMTALEQKKNHWSKVILTFSMPFLAFIFLNFFYFTNLSKITENFWMPDLSAYLFSSTLQYLLGLSTLFFSHYLNHILSFIFLGILAITLIFGKWERNFIFLFVAIFFCLEIIIYSLIRTPIFWYRSLLPSLIPFVVFIVLQIATIQAKKIKIASILLLTVFNILVTANWVTIQAYRPVEYYKQIAQLVESEWQPNNLLVFYPGYILDTVKYHFDKIPPEAGIVVYNSTKLERIKSRIDKGYEQYINNLTSIFLIVRVDLTVEIENFKNLLSVINSEIKEPFNLKTFLIISHDMCFIKERDKSNQFLAALETEFGQPTSYQDKKAYVLSEYDKI
ncbi:MAG: glycosyltransferase family 39 protein [Xenococcaceae cyanobacterium MO_207.B15]|nr:glycosyltransferase family 39 protein [Xenococcaceae cyanobacterium MO_207.B15]